jgi:DNA modification methylase
VVFDGRIVADAGSLPIADGVVQCCVTSPPYWGLRKYSIPDLIWGGDPDCMHQWSDELAEPHKGQIPDREFLNKSNVEVQAGGAGRFCLGCGAWLGQLGLEPDPQLYVEHLVTIFREARRVLRDDGTLWLNLGDSYAGSWGNYHPTGKGGQRAKNTERWGRRAYADRTFKPVTATTGTLLKPKDLVGIPWRVALALREDGWYLRSDIIWQKPNPMPESVKDRPTRSHEYLFILAKSRRYYYDADAIAEPLRRPQDMFRPNPAIFGGKKKWSGYGTRLHSGNEYKPPSGKYAQTDPNTSGRRMTESVARARSGGAEHDFPFGYTRNRRSVWTVGTESYPEAHYATFPPKLIEPCILAGSRPGDWILDPFAGSNTTGLVAEKLGRRWIACDLAYQDLQLKRLQTLQRQICYA